MEKIEAREIVMKASMEAIKAYDAQAGMSADDISRLGRASGKALDVYLQGRLEYVNAYVLRNIPQAVRVAAL